MFEYAEVVARLDGGGKSGGGGGGGGSADTPCVGCDCSWSDCVSVDILKSVTVAFE